jgi:hypothetical protein
VATAAADITIVEFDYLQELVRATSSALLEKCQEIVNNSNAIVQLFSNGSDLGISNSNAIVNIISSIKPSRFIQPAEVLQFTQNTVLDGQGAIYVFSNPDASQVIIADGVTVRLENITLSKIHAKTFSFGGNNAILEIGNNVSFELEDDIVIDQGLIRIIGTAARPNVLRIRGFGSQRILAFQPILQGQTLLNLGINTLELENIVITGLDNVSLTSATAQDGTALVGALALSGNATAHIPPVTSMNFFIQYSNNSVIYDGETVQFNGFFIWGDAYNNELNIARIDTNGYNTVPEIIFADNSIFLSSDAGRARLRFDDPMVDVLNLGSNSFVVGKHGLLSGSMLLIAGFPIKQTVIGFVVDPLLDLEANGIDRVIDSSFIRLEQEARHIKTALSHMKQSLQAEQELFREKTKIILEQKLSEEKREKLRKQSKPPQKKYITRAFNQCDDVINENKTAPANHVILTVDGKAALAQTGGVIEVRNGGILTAFSPSDAPVTVLMQGDATVIQTDLPATLKETDSIVIRGKNNKIIVRDLLKILGTLKFTPGSSCTIECAQDAENPILVFAAPLNIPDSATIIFSGEGSVVFVDGSSLALSGSDTDQNVHVSQGTQLFIDKNDPLIIQGKGKITIAHGGSIFVGPSAHLVVGNSADDDITFHLYDSGSLIIDDLHKAPIKDSAVSGSARLSLYQGRYEFLVERDGLLYIGRNGLMEINALNGVHHYGLLKSIDVIDAGMLKIDKAGELSIGPNRWSSTLYQETPFTWNAMGGIIVANGLCTLVGTPLSGIIQSSNISDIILHTTALNFVKTAINLKPDLSVSTLFQVRDGALKVLLKLNKNEKVTDSAIALLEPGDVITNDDAESGIVFGVNKNRLFTLQRAPFGIVREL